MPATDFTSTITQALKGQAETALTAVAPVIATILGARLAYSLVKAFVH